MADKLQDLIAQYLYWQGQREKAEEKLEALKETIVALAKEKEIKKIKSGEAQLLIITQTETRFPQLGEPGRKEIEKIMKESGESQEVMVFDIVALGNLYDQKKLSKQLMEKLQPFAKRERTTKIVVKKGKG